MTEIMIVEMLTEEVTLICNTKFLFILF